MAEQPTSHYFRSVGKLALILVPKLDLYKSMQSQRVPLEKVKSKLLTQTPLLSKQVEGTSDALEVGKSLDDIAARSPKAESFAAGAKKERQLNYN